MTDFNALFQNTHYSIQISTAVDDNGEMIVDAENYSQNPHIFRGHLGPRKIRVKGVILHRYVECTACNKSRHYSIRADYICFVISSSEMVNLINKA